MFLNKNKAFTLLELMISVTVLAVVLLAILSGYISCLRINEMSRSTMVATQDACRVIEQMRSYSVVALSDITSENWTTWAAANGLTSLSSEQVAVTYVDRDASGDPLDDDPLEVTVTVNWMDKNRARSLRLSSLITAR